MVEAWCYAYARVFAPEILKSSRIPISTPPNDSILLIYELYSKHRQAPVAQIVVGSHIIKTQKSLMGDTGNSQKAQPVNVEKTFVVREVREDCYILENEVLPTGWRLWDAVKGWWYHERIQVNKQDIHGWTLKCAVPI
jgi:hypothetical protein